MSLLMSAIVSFLNESVVESLKGAYKLRKAYQLLQKLYDMIVEVDGKALMDSNQGTNQTAASQEELSDDSDDDFVDATNDFVDLVKPTADLMDSSKISTRSEAITLNTTEILDTRPSSSSTIPTVSSRSPNIDRRASTVTVSTTFNEIPTPQQADMTITDQAVYSGTLMALGFIMLLVSLLPPSLSRLLSIIGFRASRPQALSMLWKVTANQGPFGGLATFGLGTYYGNIIQNSDIISDEFSTQREGSAGTIEKLHVAILSVRRRYPGSALWVVEEVLSLWL